MKTKRILAVRNDRFGEFLLNIPAFRALKESNPGSELILAVDPEVEELARCFDFVDDVVLWANKKHSIVEILYFSNLLRRKKIDLCVILNPSKESNIAVFLSGIPSRVGYSRKWGFLLNRTMHDDKHSGQKHEIEYNLDLASLAGARGSKDDIHLYLTDDCAKELLSLVNIGSFVTIHPWTSDPVKQWPVERFLELAQRITKELNLKVVFIGGKKESIKFMDHKGKFNENMLDLTGRTSLIELAAVIKKSSFLVSCDSGPVHLASCVSRPSVVIFRNDLTGKTSRRWGPVSPGSIVIENPDLDQISVDDCFSRVKDLYGKLTESRVK